MKNDSTDYPSQTFVAQINYQEAHRRADARARHCLQGFPVTGTVYTDNETSVMRKFGVDMAYPLEEVRARAVSATESEVTITVWGVGVWDTHEIAAMRQSIETGTPVCRQYQKRD